MKFVASMLALSATVGAVTLAACTPQQNPNNISNAEAGRIVPVRYGTVSSVRAVNIRPGQTRLGTVIGAALGGTAGSTIGRSTTANVAGAIGGAVAGGALGSAIQGSGNTPGLEISIRLDSGENVAVVQPGDPRDFRVGDRVRLTGDSESARVTR